MASRQCYKNDALKILTRQNVGGGQGPLHGRFSHTRDEAPGDWVIREIGWMTLQPGDSIGLHGHVDNEDTYIIISGEGVFTDSNGVESPVGPGDITIARKGESHALKNSGSEPLEFLDIIAQ